MNNFRIFLLLCLCVFFVASKCKKPTGGDDDNPPKPNVYKVHTVKRAYYTPDNKRYFTNQFSPAYVDFIYKFKVEAGKEYKFRMYGIDMSVADLFVTNREGLVLKQGIMSETVEGGEYAIFESPADDTIHIFVRATDINRVSQKEFYIAVEELNSYILTWKGYRWLCDGDWTVNHEDEMVFKGHKSGNYKWIKLLDKNLDNYEAEFVVHSPGNDLRDFAGMAVTSANTIHHGYNLPETGSYFRFRAPNQWNLMLIDLKDSGELKYVNGTVGQAPDFNSLAMQSTVEADSISFFVMEKDVLRIPNHANEQQLFFVVEDKSFDNVILRDFKLKE